MPFFEGNPAIRSERKRGSSHLEDEGNNMQGSFFALLLAGWIWSAPSDSVRDTQQPSANLCDPATEVAVFSCSTGTKRADVCATRDLDESSGSIQYRFGKPGAIELALPAATKGRQSIEGDASIYASGASAMHLRFKSGSIAYVVYDISSNDEATDGTREWTSQSGVVVEKSGAVALHLRCKDSSADVSMGELEELLFDKAKLARDVIAFTPPKR